jgi:PAS domain S-box-containing protein
MSGSAAGIPPAVGATGFDRARATLRAQVDRLVDARRLGSDDEHRRLAESLPLIVWVADADGRARYLNQRWYDFTGLDESHSVGYGWNDVIHRDDLDTAFARWTHAINTGEPLEVSYRFRRSDGTFRWHLGIAVLRHSPDDRALEWVGGCLDVDELFAGDDGLRGVATAHEATPPASMSEHAGQA